MDDWALQTERLQLRRVTLDDADLMLAVWTDPAFVRNGNIPALFRHGNHLIRIVGAGNGCDKNQCQDGPESHAAKFCSSGDISPSL